MRINLKLHWNIYLNYLKNIAGISIILANSNYGYQYQ